MGTSRQPHRTLNPALGRCFVDQNHAVWRVWSAMCQEDCTGFHGTVKTPGRKGEVWYTPGTWDNPQDAFTAALAIFDQVAARAGIHVEVERVL